MTINACQGKHNWGTNRGELEVSVGRNTASVIHGGSSCLNQSGSKC